jgi:phytoene synthase
MPIPADILEAYLYCDKIARSRAKNFYPAFRFLPKPRRLALSAFYAFCSLSDDIADNNSTQPLQNRIEQLADWKQQLDDCFNGNPKDPIFIATHDSMNRYNLPKAPFFDLLDGVEMDFKTHRYNTFSELELYCRRVASSVGRISIRIFGCDGPNADAYADALGIAFQLTNIMRDIDEDYQRDRIYIPLDEMEQYQYSETDINKKIYDERFIRLMQLQYDRAVKYLAKAKIQLLGDQASKLLTAEVMRSVYKQLLEEIRNHNFNIYQGRISVNRWTKIQKIVKTFLYHKFTFRS